MNRVRELRIQAGMQQKELALALGVAQPSVSNWEKQKSDPADENVEKLAQIFGVDVSYIVYYSSPSITEKSAVAATLPPPPSPPTVSGLTDADLAKIAELIQPAEAPRTVEARIVSFAMDNLPKEDRERLLAMIRALYSNRPELFNTDKKGDTDDARY